jgi:hypothetical protein
MFSVLEAYLSVQLAAGDPIPDLFNTTGEMPLETNLTWAANTTGATYFADSFNLPVKGYDIDPFAVGLTLTLAGCCVNLVRLPFIKSFVEHMIEYVRALTGKDPHHRLTDRPVKKMVLPMLSMASALYLAGSVAFESAERFDALSTGPQAVLGVVFALSWLSQNWFSVSSEWVDNALHGEHEHPPMESRLGFVLFILGNLCGLADFALTAIRMVNGGWNPLPVFIAMGVLSLTVVFEMADASRLFLRPNKHHHHHHSGSCSDDPEGQPEAVATSSSPIKPQSLIPWKEPQTEGCAPKACFGTGFGCLVMGHFVMMAADFLVVNLKTLKDQIFTVLGMTCTVIAALGEVLFHTQSWSIMVDWFFTRRCLAGTSIDVSRRSSVNTDRAGHRSAVHSGMFDRDSEGGRSSRATTVAQITEAASASSWASSN